MRDSKSLVCSSSGEIEAFLRKAESLPVPAHKPGRLLFALDATASREHVWDQACHIQASMFEEAGKIGSLQIQLCYYRGHHEFHRLPWTADAQALAKGMGGVRCRAGLTQLSQVFKHALAEAAREPVQALVFVGDAVEEPPQLIYDLAGKLAIRGVPVFMFQEGDDAQVRSIFKRVAGLTRGAYASFDQASAEHLRQLLCAVAVFASGGVRALKLLARSGGAEVKALTRQVSGSEV